MLIGGPRTLKDPRIQNLLWRMQDPGPHNDPDPYEDTGTGTVKRMRAAESLLHLFVGSEQF